MPVAVDKILVWSFVAVSLGKFHTVLFFKSFNLAVAEHRKTRHCNHQCTYTKVFVILSELGNGSVFVRVVHEVYVALKNLRVKLNRILYGIAVFLVFLFLEHVHECTVVNSVHTQGSDEVSFHHPECFCQKKCIRNFTGYAVYNFTPEFVWNLCFKFLVSKS